LNIVVHEVTSDTTITASDRFAIAAQGETDRWWPRRPFWYGETRGLHWWTLWWPRWYKGRTKSSRRMRRWLCGLLLLL